MRQYFLIVLILAVVVWFNKDPSITIPQSDIKYTYIVKYMAKADKSDPLPMIILLHGNGDKPHRFFKSTFHDINVPCRIILVQAPIPWMGGFSWPYQRTDVLPYGSALKEFVGLLLKKYQTAGKPVLAGFSGGGNMANFLAVTDSNTYSSVISVSGDLDYGDLPDDNTILNNSLRVYLYHGKDDRLVSISGGRQAEGILNELGFDVEFNEFEGGHHGIFTNMREEIRDLIENNLRAQL